MDAVESEPDIEQQPGEPEVVFAIRKALIAGQMDVAFPLAHIHNVFVDPADPGKTVVFLRFLGTVNGMLVPSAAGISFTVAEIESHPGTQLAVLLKARIQKGYAGMLKLMLEQGVTPVPPVFEQVYRGIGFRPMPRKDQIVAPDKRIKIARAQPPRSG
jgi:hypothetical protein